MFKKYKKIHFIGAGGIGISALAKWAHLEGVNISGSDVEPSEITRELEDMGIKIATGHKKENVPSKTDLIVYSSAVPKTNPERDNKLPQKSYFEFLGELTRGKKTIAISGTNGKSTTTAMLGKILVDAGLNPIVVVGSKIRAFSHGNFNYGKGEYAVIEGCEHNAQMLNLHPWSIVITNIEADHLDFYKNLKNILSAFKKYVKKVKESGFLVYNADDKNTLSVISTQSGMKKISYGVHENADIRFENRYIDESKNKAQIFDIIAGDKELKGAKLKVPGLFNAYNALGGFAVARELGVSLKKASKSLSEFSGLWRRFEQIGEYNGAPVISDYGHHPHAIEATVLGAKEFYPDRRIILVFEPHQHHRTKALFADFVRAFDRVDVLILGEIYNVSGRVEKKDRQISSRKLSDAIIKYWETDENKDERKIHELFYCKKHDDILKTLKDIVKHDDIVIIMGAGNIYKIAKQLCEIKNQ